MEKTYQVELNLKNNGNMNYDEIANLLIENDIFPKKEMYRDEVDSYHCIGLRVYCSPLLKDKKVDYIKGLLGEMVHVNYLPNNDEIKINL